MRWLGGSWLGLAVGLGIGFGCSGSGSASGSGSGSHSEGTTGGEEPADESGDSGTALAARWTGRGETAYAAGDFVRAGEAFDRALQALPGTPRAAVGKARCLIAA